MVERSKQGGLMVMLLLLLLLLLLLMMMCVLSVHRLVRFVENKDKSDQIFQDIHRIRSDETTSDSKSDDALPN
jgi:hypothetical protein